MNELELIYPNGMWRPMYGPIPRAGEKVILDSYAQFKAGSFLVKQVIYESKISHICARVFLAEEVDNL